MYGKTQGSGPISAGAQAPSSLRRSCPSHNLRTRRRIGGSALRRTGPALSITMVDPMVCNNHPYTVCKYLCGSGPGLSESIPILVNPWCHTKTQFGRTTSAPDLPRPTPPPRSVKQLKGPAMVPGASSKSESSPRECPRLAILRDFVQQEGRQTTFAFNQFMLPYFSISKRWAISLLIHNQTRLAQ